jgi:hypothetical protein
VAAQRGWVQRARFHLQRCCRLPACPAAPSGITLTPIAEGEPDTADGAGAMNGAERGAANGAARNLLGGQMSFTAIRRLDSLRRRKPSSALHALVDCLKVGGAAVAGRGGAG